MDLQGVLPEAGDARQDFIRGLAPLEGFRIVVVGIEEFLDRGFKCANRTLGFSGAFYVIHSGALV